MSYVRNHSPSTERDPLPTCVFLRSKAIYVTGRRAPDDADEDGSHFCWCNQTQRELGPDGLAVAPGQCTPVRACYQLSR